MKLQPPVLRSPLPQLLKDSEAAMERHHYHRAIELLERAAPLAPHDPCILLDLGRAHGMLYDYAAAERFFEKAIRISGWKPAAFLAAGLHCQAFGRHELARRYFDRTLQRNGASTEALVQLAAICERQNQLEAAADYLDRALSLDGNCAPALLLRAKLERHAGRLESAEKILRSFVAKPNPDTWTHAQSWYELGGVLDRQGRYDEAMAAFLEAKALMRPTAEKKIPELRKAQARARKNSEAISADVLRRWFEAGNELKPTQPLSVLCGHPRSGTTLLEQVLDAHPDVISAEETLIFQNTAYYLLARGFPPDLDSFLPILDAAPLELLRKARAQYRQAMEAFLGESIGGRLLIDKNPSFTTLIPALARVFPEVKFLVALRDPRDVCLSCFIQPLPPQGAAVAYASLAETVTEFTSVLGFWQTLKPRLRNPCLEVRYEDVVAGLETAARRVFDFLNVPWDGRALQFDEHARRKVVRSPTYADVRKPIYKTALGRWRNYQKYFEPHQAELAPFVKAFGFE